MVMKEQFHSKIEGIENRELIIIGIVFFLVLGGLLVFNSDNKEMEEDQLNLNVGEDAWEEPKAIEIDDKIKPSNTDIKTGSTVKWVNKRDSRVGIGIEGTNKEFIIGSNESQTLNPVSSFDYKVFSQQQYVGKGRVTVQ